MSHEGGEDAKGRCCRRLPEWRRAITEDLARMHCLPRPRPLYREKESAVNGSELAADQIFINVGARAAIPPTPGLDQVPYLTNSSMMDIDFLPPHLVIMGGSYIGLEFAQAYRRFGSEVTVIELGPHLISREEVTEFAQIPHSYPQNDPRFR